MTIQTVKGNIMETDKDIIVQQVNCLGLMGAGLAKTIVDRYPNVKTEYVKYCRRVELPEELLGRVQYVSVYDGREIANVFGQLDIRKHRFDRTVYTNTEALLRGIDSVRKKAETFGQSIAIPTYIGCGLAGGNWDEILEYIGLIFKDSPVDVTLYDYR